MPIRVLEPTVAAQIAAGEVIERPASVVKELVENALDAGARRVTVRVRGGGIDELVIQDDGSGIPADEIALAFERHATSKLTSADDLWAIQTLGFRGEALPSIATIAQVICTSRTASAETGTELRIAAGQVQHVSACGGPVGTTFTIRNLFYNVPVRREFLKSPAAEAAAIAAVVTQYALAYPQVAFALVRDGKRVFQTTGRGQLADVLLELYGVEVARQMLPIDARAGEDLGAVHVQGMASAPTLSRSSRDGMHLTVNGRAIQPRGQVGAIVEEAYHTLLMKGRFPLVVLHIQVHPAAVDVNVHPTKSEVKFRQPQLVGRTLGRAVRDAVQGSVVIQGWADPDAAPEATPAEQGGWPIAAPPASGDVDGPPADVPATPGDTSASDVAALGAADPWPLDAAPAAADRAPSQAALFGSSGGDLADRRHPEPLADRAAPDQDADAATAGHAPGADAAGWVAPPQALDQQPSTSQVREMPAEPYPPQAEAPRGEHDHAAPAGRAPGLPPLRALAQLAQTYLLAEGPGGALYLIDQHAAHERITYERLLMQHGAGSIQSQALLLPQHSALRPDAQQALLGAADELAAWGLVIEEADRGVQIRSVPAGLAVDELASTLADLASYFSGGGGRTPADRRDATLATLACHTSVRAGQTLTLAEQQGLLDQLTGCEGPRTCPHGRPTVIVLTKHQLERQFGRLGA
jgi:DNA mismatch repair protein MutL